MEQMEFASLDKSAMVFGGHWAIKSDSAQAVALAVPALAPASELPQPPMSAATAKAAVEAKYVS